MPMPAPPSARPTAAGRYGSRRGYSLGGSRCRRSRAARGVPPASTGTPTSVAEPLGEAGELRRATGDDDAQQARRARLVAVVVERAADFVEQHRERTLDRGACARDELVVARVPSWRFSASAVSGGMFSSAAIASVSSRPPVPSTRTNRGMPPSCTAIAVTPPPNDTMPSALDTVVVDRRSRERADQRERQEVDRGDGRPAASTTARAAPSAPRARRRAAPASRLAVVAGALCRGSRSRARLRRSGSG